MLLYWRMSSLKDNIHISKEQFVEALTAIKEGLDDRARFDKALSEFSNSWFVSTVGTKWLDTAIRLLEIAVNDTLNPKYGSVISWWLYENAKVVYIQPHTEFNDTDEQLEVGIETAEELYDFFVKYR